MLDEKYVMKALEELRETDEMRESRLEEFRLWISKSDFFKNCRQDDTFLLQFLRTKKFDMERATDLFERFMLLKNSYPKWFDYDEKEEDKMWSLYETGFLYPLVERDEEGRRIIFVQPRRIDPKTHKFADIVRLTNIIAQTLLEEQETQISGIAVILDCTDMPMSLIRLCSVSDLVNFANVIRTSAIGRHKKMIMVALPGFASFLLEAIKKVIGEKLRNRIKLVKSMGDIEDEINISMLPHEFGGNIPESVMIEDFRRIAVERQATVKGNTEGVDWDKVALEGDDETCTIS